MPFEVTEIIESRSLSAKAGEGYTLTRAFLVRADSPNPALFGIINSIGVYFWDAHPETTLCRAKDFQVKPRGGSLMLYTVTVTYEHVPPREQERDTPQQDPENPTAPPVRLPGVSWSGSTGVTELATSKDVLGFSICNSARVPYDGVTKRAPAPTLTCVKPYITLAAAQTAIKTLVGKTNSKAWAGGLAEEWMCEGGDWAWKHEGQENSYLSYVEVTFRFTFMDGTHRLKLNDVGYMELVSGKLKTILGEDGKQVKEPVALTAFGAANPGVTPSIVNGGNGFQLYGTVDFATVVGNPT